MSDWISRKKALAIVQLKMPSVSDPESLLDEAIGNDEIVVQRIEPPPARESIDFTDSIRLYAGGLTYADLHDGYGIEPDVSRSSLEDWISEILGTAKKVKTPASPRSLADKDMPLIEQMRGRIEERTASSATAAINQMIREDPSIVYGASETAFVRRLQRRYKETYGE